MGAWAIWPCAGPAWRPQKAPTTLATVLGDIGCQGPARPTDPEIPRPVSLGGSDQGGDTGLHFIEGPGREPDQGRCGLGQGIQHGLVAIALLMPTRPEAVSISMMERRCPGLVMPAALEQSGGSRKAPA